MSKRRRIYELAKELGIPNQELVTKINELPLGIRASNVMTVLSEDEVTKVKRALKANGSSGEAAAAAPVKRRGGKKKKAAPKKASAAKTKADDKDEGAGAGVGPVMIRRNRRSQRAAEEEAAQAAAQAEAEAAAKREAEEAAQAAQAAEAEVEAAPEPEREVEATPQPEPVAEPELEPEPAQPAAAQDEPQQEPAAAAAAAATPEAKPARAPEGDEARPAAAAVAAAAAGKPGARILGTIDLGTMQDRLEGRDFNPPPPSGGADRGRSRKGRSGPGGGGRRGGNNRPGRQVRDVGSLYVGGRGGRGSKRGSKKAQRAKKTEITQAAEHKRVVRIEDTITLGDLGREMGVKSGHLALKLMEMGMMANVNTTLDLETAQLIALEFGYTVENVAFDIAKFYDTAEDPEESLKARPPVVTVMGHVDHGKTSLLDAIRSSKVTATEAGGITQHIGAYTVETEQGGQITFLDTPGHEAFTALRARGAQATDIVILVVAADDGVMPQTAEAINHSRDAGVPIIVAINKIDKPSANPDRIKQALIEYQLTPEEWGGETQYVAVSALQGTNVAELVEQVALRAEVEELKANPERNAQGIVIESQLDVGRGPLATVLVRRGTLRSGDIMVVGEHYGRVRTMADHLGALTEQAGPSIPVEVTGLGGVPEAGEPFFVVKEERDAKLIADNVAEQRRQKRMAALSKSNMDRLRDLIDGTGHRKLKLIVKADVQGSIEALRQAFANIGNDEVSIEVIHSAVGSVTENDVNLAASSEDAVVVVGFNVRPDNRAMEIAEKYGVEVMTFTIIYDAIDRLRSIVEGMLNPIQEENVIGQAEVRETFHAPKVGTIAGCYVTQGQLKRNAKARLYRNGKLIYDSQLASLRRFKDDVKEVKSGFECGTSIQNYNDVKVGDIIEAYEVVEVAATLA